MFPRVKDQVIGRYYIRLPQRIKYVEYLFRPYRSVKKMTNYELGAVRFTPGYPISDLRPSQRVIAMENETMNASYKQSTLQPGRISTFWCVVLETEGL